MAICPYCRENLRDEDHFTVHLENCSQCLYNTNPKSSHKKKVSHVTKVELLNKNSGDDKPVLATTDLQQTAQREQWDTNKRAPKYKRKKSGKRLAVKRRGRSKKKKQSTAVKYKKKRPSSTKIDKKLNRSSKTRQSKIKRPKSKTRTSKSKITKTRTQKSKPLKPNKKDGLNNIGHLESDGSNGQTKNPKSEPSSYNQIKEFSSAELEVNTKTKHNYERNIKLLCEEYMISRESLLQNKSIYDEIWPQARNMGNRYTCAINYGRRQLNLKPFKRNKPEEEIIDKTPTESMVIKEEEKKIAHLATDRLKITKQTLNQYIQDLLLEIEQDIDG